MSKLLTIQTGDVHLMRYIDFTIEFKNDNVIVCSPWASWFSIEDWLSFENVIQKGYPSICKCDHPIAAVIKTTGRLQLIMAGVEISQKLQMAFIDSKYLIRSANLNLNGMLYTNNRCLFFPDIEQSQLDADSVAELLVNNRVGRVTIDDGIGGSISKIYVPYNTPCKYHSSVSKNTKKLWNKIASNMSNAKYGY